MDLKEAACARHSVRAYEQRPLADGVKEQLKRRIAEINARRGLHIQLVTDEPAAFGKSMLAHYGKFENAANYFAIIGKKSDKKLQEKCGYFGEELVLYAQTLGLNTCWAALTYKKTDGAYELGEGEKLVLVIAVGYGKTQGARHRNRPYSAVCSAPDDAPAWFKNGVYGALLAPTAVNQQKFKFILHEDGKVEAKAGAGFYTKIDLGIAKYHFELFAGKNNFEWKEQ